MVFPSGNQLLGAGLVEKMGEENLRKAEAAAKGGAHPFRGERVPAPPMGAAVR